VIPKKQLSSTLKKASLKEILGHVDPALADKSKVLRQVKNPQLCVDLENFEIRQVCILYFILFLLVLIYFFSILQKIKNYKIGILYCKDGQIAEGEMFCNGMPLLSCLSSKSNFLTFTVNRAWE